MANRMNQLKNLYDEAQELFDNGVNADNAYDQLSSRLQFSTITREDINYIYKKLQKKVELNAKQEELSAERKRCSTHLENVYSEQKRLKLEIKHVESEDQILNAKKERLTTEYVQLKPYRQNAQKHLICDNMKFNPNASIMKFWNDRFVLTDLKAIRHGFGYIDLVDLFHQKAKSVFISHSCYFERFNTLIEPYSLMVEYKGNDIYALNLLEFDPKDSAMRVIQSIERSSFLKAFVDSANSKKFIFRRDSIDDEFSGQICTLVDGQIEVGEEFEWNASGELVSYSDDKLISIIWDYSTDEILMRLQVYDLITKEHNILDVKAFPESIRIENENSVDSYAWLHNRCFVAVKFASSENYGIAFTSLETLDWTILEFAFNFPIKHLHFVNGSDLMVHTKEAQSHNDSKEVDQKIYKIPMCKPNRLRCMAWFKVIEFYKKKQVKDPQRKARLRLSPESDLQLFKSIQ